MDQKEKDDVNKDMLATLSAFGIRGTNGDDIRERSYSMPAGDLKKLQKKSLKVRFGSSESRDGAAGHGEKQASSDKDLPQLLQAFGIVPPPWGRKCRGNNGAGDADADFSQLMEMCKPNRQKKAHKSEEILATLTSKSAGNSEECLAVLEAFGVILSSETAPVVSRVRPRSFTVPCCDLKTYTRPKTKRSVSALNLGETSSSSYESAIIGEAHGLISDMLADSSLPPHVVSGLHAVSNLLKPPENHGPVHKPRVSPLVSLTETNNYGSDSEDLPYTGERPSSLPKRLRRSLPPSLIRRMSTSTWTTTTSATGLPTLEPEPCRTRSCSFRHSRDNTPGSSPSGSRSNSPSPSSPTALSLTIPKSRSFSATTGIGLGNMTSGSLTNQKRGSRDRRTMFQPAESSATPSPVHGTAEKIVSPLPKGEDLSQSRDGLNSGPNSSGVCKRFNITSDYESSDSPSSSDHSDTIMSVDDISGPVLSPARPGRIHTSENTAASPRLDPDKVSTKSPRGEVAPPSSSSSLSSSHQASITIPAAATSAAASSSSSSSSSSHTASSCSSVTASGVGVVASSAAAASSPSSPNSAPRWDNTKKDNASSRSLCSEAGQLVREVDSTAASYDVPTSDGDQYTATEAPYSFEDVQENALLDIEKLNRWDYSIFDLSVDVSDCILSMVACKIFSEAGLFETFRIPIDEFIHYFHALELGYREKPYHNRIHATDVLHGVYYLSTQPIPGFQQMSSDCDIFHHKSSSSESDSDVGERCCARINFTAEDTYGIMGGNLPPLELMALYAAAAMHDYDHPGRTNAFLVTTNAPLAILYNDRSVLESHHAASAWRLYLSDPKNHWLVHLDKAEFKRFRFLVIEAILATDLKRHFELLAEFNAKVNDEDGPGIDWTSETDRLMASNMVIKMADINGPCKGKDLHVNWTNRISEEFYEQGDEEQSLGLQISPYMDRKHPQLAKLQESFINHLVAPLCNALGAAGLIPGTWIEGISDSDATDTEKGDSSSYKDTEDESTEVTSGTPTGEKKKKFPRKMHCYLTQNLKDNHDMWVSVLKQEVAQKEREAKQADDKKEPQHRGSLTEKEMEPITEEDTPPNSANNLGEELEKAVDRLTYTSRTPGQKRGSQSGSSSHPPADESD